MNTLPPTAHCPLPTAAPAPSAGALTLFVTGSARRACPMCVTKESRPGGARHV